MLRKNFLFFSCFLCINLVSNQSINAEDQTAFTTIEDTFVRSNRPTRLYGHSYELRVRRSSSADYNAYFKFDVSGLEGTVESAILKTYVIDGSSEGGEVFSVPNTYAHGSQPWEEEELVYENAPEPTGSPLSSVDEVEVDEFVEFDVTAAVDGNGVYSFALSSDVSDAVKFSSKEGETAPRLVVVTETQAESEPEPETEPTSATSPVLTAFTPISGSVGTEVTIAGTDLDETTNVLFNGVPASEFTVDSSIQLTASVPVGASTGKIALVSAKGTTLSSDDFVVNSSSNTLRFIPSDDSFVRSNRPTRLYGHADELRVRESSSADYNTYLKFPVSGLSGVVRSAAIRMYVIEGGPQGGTVFTVSNHYRDSNSPWDEGGLIFENAPSISGEPLSSIGEVNLDEFVEFDVTAAVTGNGTYSFAFTSNISEVARYGSKEGIVSPELVIVTDGGEGENDEAPEIAGFAPNSGPIGTEVTIIGNNFNNVTGVSFQGTPAIEFTVDATSQVRTEVPTGATTGKIGITTEQGTATSAAEFTVVQAPTISSFTPSSGVPGTEITVAGTNFIEITDVSFNGSQPADFEVDSADQLRARVPSGASTGQITVQNAAGTATSGTNFTVTEGPSTITLIPTDDSFVRSNRPTRIYGHAHELRVRETSSADHFTMLKFSVFGTGGTIQSATLKLLVIDESVEGGAIYSISNHFLGTNTSWNEQELHFENAPTVEGSPFDSKGPVDLGAVVEFDVTDAMSGDGVYSFAIANNSSDLANYSSKEGAQPPTLIIETLAGGSSGPFITSFHPESGPVGSVITIVGGNFNAVSEVSFNDEPGSFTVESTNELHATVPSGASTGKITVTTDEGTATSADDFEVLVPPTVASFSPTSGPPGTEVTITGTGFSSESKVQFNGVAANGLHVDSDIKLRADVPLGATTGQVSVTNSVGMGVSSDEFTVTESSGPSVLVLTPTDDAFVRSNRPERHYGHAHELRVRRSSSADYNAYLKFNVTGLADAVQSAVLRLFVIDSGDEGGRIFSVSNNYQNSSTPWNEDDMIYDNAPPLTASPLSSVGPVEFGEMVEFDVTEAITQNGVFSFAISNDSRDLSNYSSKEGVQVPELVIHTGEAPSLEPVISSFSPTSGPAGVEVTINGANFVSSNDDNSALNTSGTIRIMPLGDSITQGVHGSTDNAGYRNDLAELLDSQGFDYDFVGTKRDGSGFDRDHEGHSGVRADELLAELNSYLNSNPPDLILLHIGTNDISALQTPETTVDEIGEILDTIHRFDGTILTILSSVVPRKDRKDDETTTLNSFISNLFSIKQNAGYNLTYVDMNEAFKENLNWEDDYMDDSVHPNDTGYAVMAGVWFDAILDAFTDTDDMQVAFNGVDASDVIVDSETRLRVRVPSDATTGEISVTNSFGTGFSGTDFAVTSGSTSVLALAYPLGGEEWPVGSTHTVMWRSIGDISAVNLEYSVDEGQTWNTIAENVPNSGKFIWNVPKLNAHDCLVRIADRNNLNSTTMSKGTISLVEDKRGPSLPSLADMKLAAIGQAGQDSYVLQQGDLNKDGVVDLFDILNMLDLNIDYNRIHPELALQDEEDAYVKLSVSDTKSVGQDSVIIPVSIEQDVPIRGFHVQLHYEESQLTFATPLQLKNLPQMQVYSHVSPNTIDVLAYLKKENSAVDMNGVLLNLVAKLNEATHGKLNLGIKKAAFASKDNRPLKVSLDSKPIEVSQIPDEFRLFQNYPNPFNITTRINFHLPEKSKVKLEIYNLRGELVRTLIDQEKEPGQYKIEWNGKNDSDAVVASGIYIYRIQAGNWEAARRLALIK